MNQNFNNGRLLLGALASVVVIQPVQAQNNLIFDIQIQETVTGVEIRFQTLTDESLDLREYIEGNTTVIEILGVNFDEANENSLNRSISDGLIDSVDVVRGDNSVQIRITGKENPPSVFVEDVEGALMISAFPVASTGEVDTIDLIVTANRREEDITRVSRSVTVIDRDTIQQQTALTSDFGQILGKLVPGFGPASERAFTASSLRGRGASILIDGVPLNVNNRDFDRELQTISPNAVERIEVVRGPSALYGGEATGGIINIITRRGEEDRVVSNFEVGIDAALGGLEGDSFGNFIRYGVSGKQDNVDFVVDFSRDDSGASFDAQGDRIPTIQGNDESDTYNILGKLGVQLDENQRLQLTANYFYDRRESAFIADPIVDEIPGVQKARALEVGELEFPAGGGPQLDENFLFNVSYSHQDLGGNVLNSQIYYRDNVSRTDPRDRRPRAFGIFQGNLNSQNWGGRLSLDTPINPQLRVLWGLDYDKETTSNTFNLFDPDDFDASNGRVNTLIEERILVPSYDLSSLGLLAQLQWNATENLTLNGGLRYENIDVSVGDYTTFFGDFIEGGDDSFDDFLFNIGASYRASEEITLFTNFSQGFSVPDFGIVFGFPDPGFSVGQDVDITQPQKVNEFELGVRGNWANIQASLTGFYNFSDFGSAFDFNNDTGLFDIVRAPERVYGIEGTIDAQINDLWAVGGSLSWSDGEADLGNDGNYVALSSARISPIKLTAYVQNQTTPNWTNRLQAMFIGDRTSAFNEGVDPSPINSYIVLDFISSVKIGQGTLQIGVENLLDTFYFPAYAQRTKGFSETFNSAGSGRTVSLKYSISW
ncbi:TonB-dependent receptor [Cyanobacterium stanieri LEGE 03274]|uniref:TonB-dependent receptor n=1 Tax=Cyanobacterium stanieri LEGE 03274 TaxID=1828756 RepID=A0ABR9V7E5_9CHRO|nr:TonB-dependent receptor [Cyanobacterium stanieri]MBE9223041.1 TonB-dependent receptor [Cyanobacterium stanieri LEGE 03274]